jgi:two-component system NtrC family sensor kinase
MAISYRIVQEHGGRIDVSSREGVGTAITVSLPVSATMRNAVA